MSQVYYVAQIDTYYAVIGLGDSEAEAIRVAAERAKRYLDQAGAFDPDMGEAWTVERIIDYFDPRVSALGMNTAILEGVEG
jgi:hypothetical protein